uniref:Universal stress protein A n=1 Tax=Magnetococcus massalia (strain MO-1) TaxID=451514 RepID=A0A1S7LQ47_MAGMO|nr:Universal stress protein A [Candidatus Magnetococcus massalia]
MKCIMAMTDLTASGQAVVDQAKNLAQLLDCRLYLIHVAHVEGFTNGPARIGHEIDPTKPRRQEAAYWKEQHHQLQEMTESLRSEGLDAVGLMIEGDLQTKFCEEVERYSPEYVVIGSHKHGKLYQMLVGCQFEKVIRDINRPLVVVPLAA